MDSTPDAPTDVSADRSDRDDTLGDLDDVREYARYKVFGDGRIRDEGKERIRIRYLKTIAYAANVDRQIRRDKELEAMQRQIDELRNKIEL